MRCVVFSRDRAMQLDAFLRTAPYRTPFVLWTASDRRHEESYRLLAFEHPGVKWVRERDFAADVRRLVPRLGRVVFHTDDDLFFRKAPRLRLRRDEVCFSLRLGLNTAYCYALDVDAPLRDPVLDRGRVRWRWREQREGNYSYPLALNGHVFRAADVRRWFAALDFANPNELEAAMQVLLDGQRPWMASAAMNSVVSVPANVVQSTFPNRHAGGAPGELLDRFLADERIDVAAMDFEDVRSCHQEIPFVFRGRR